VQQASEYDERATRRLHFISSKKSRGRSNESESGKQTHDWRSWEDGKRRVIDDARDIQPRSDENPENPEKNPIRLRMCETSAIYPKKKKTK